MSPTPLTACKESLACAASATPGARHLLALASSRASPGASNDGAKDREAIRRGRPAWRADKRGLVWRRGSMMHCDVTLLQLPVALAAKR